MHGGMLYDPIQGQCHGVSEIPKIALFTYRGSWQMTTNS